MTPALTICLLCFATGVVSFVILIPLEFGLRRFTWVIFPKLGVAMRRMETQVNFDTLRLRAFSQPDICVCDIDANHFFVSTANVRCMAERSACGNRTALVFRFPLGLVLLVISVVAGIVLPQSFEAVNGAVNILGFAFCVVFMVFLGLIFLLAFKSMADGDSDKLLYLLGLPINAQDGFLFRRLSRNRSDSQPKSAQADTLDFRHTWFADLTDNLFALFFTAVLIPGMVCFSLLLDSGLFSWVFIAFVIIIGLVVWTTWLRYLLENYRERGDFTFLVTYDFIACECPSPARGGSFKLFFQDIKEIRIESGNCESERCFVIDRSGRVFEITHSYRNPVDRILDAIESVSPTTPIFEFGVPRHAYTTSTEQP